MRTLLMAMLGLASCVCLAGCDVLFAEAKVTKWISKSSGMGIIVQQTGDEIEAEMVMFQEVMDMPEPEAVEEGEPLGGFPLSRGVVDKEENLLVFPLQNNTLARSNSARLLRKNNRPYVEFDLDFSGTVIEGRWRRGDQKATIKHKFLLCGVEHEKK